MATFKFGRYINIHWNGYDIQGPAETVFSIPDQLYEEFNGDIAPVEPTLVWIDTNEFQTLQNSVPRYTIAATDPIAIGSSTATSGAVTKTWSLNANYATSTHDHSGVYQAAGTYVSSLTATSPLSGSISSAGLLSVSINTTGFQSSGTYVNAIIGSSPASVATASGTATVSISSGTSPNGYLLAANGSGGVIFTPASTSGLTSVVGISPISTAISGGTVSVSVDTTTLDAATAATLRTYVKNASGATINKGQAVYVSGADGTNALIDVSSASNEITSSKTLGILASTLTNNAFGYVIENGQLSNIDTSATTAGASVWLGNTPGSLVFGAPPAEPSNTVYLGVVTKANVSTGEILVNVQNGYELDELHDVSVGTASDLDILQYKSSSSMWTKTGLTAAGIVTPTGTQTLTNKTLTLPSIANTTGNYTTTVSTASTTTVLTSSSTYYQYVTGTGSSSYRIQLPNTSTLTVGHSYEIHNNSSNQFGILTSLGTSVLTLINGFSYRITCIDTSSNATSAWDLEAVGGSTTTGTGSLVFSSTPTLSSPTFGSTVIFSSAGVRISPTTIATSGGSTAVSNTANYYIRMTGTTTHILNLSATPTAGASYIIRNDSTGDVTVNASGGGLVATIKQGQGIFLVCLTSSGTTAADWAAHFLGGPSVTGTGSSVRSASPTLTGDLTINAQGDLRLADADSSNWVALQAPATVASNVTWTLPSADGTSGQILSTDGSATLSWASAGMSLISSATISSGVSTVAKPSNAKIAFIRLISGGNGGNTYAESSANGIGAAGGNGGGVTELWVNASEFTSPISYSVGAGGSGAVAVAYTSATIATTTTIGTAGGSTTFGPYAAVANQWVPGGPTPAGASAPTNAGGGGFGGNLNAGGGASGGTSTSARASGAGGIPLTIKYSTSVAGGGAAAGTESTANNVSGLNGSNATVAGGGGGAGGSYRGGAVQTANRSSGNGGNGAYPGGGGGAGGAANSSAANISTFTLTAGSGGNGAGGQIYVEWYG